MDRVVKSTKGMEEAGKMWAFRPEVTLLKDTERVE
jgi:hypothetical protein